MKLVPQPIKIEKAHSKLEEPDVPEVIPLRTEQYYLEEIAKLRQQLEEARKMNDEKDRIIEQLKVEQIIVQRVDD